MTGPRFAFIAVEEPDSDRKLLLAVKTTNGPKAAGLGYRVVGTSVDHRFTTSCVEWDDGPVTVSANEALRAANGGTRLRKVDEAVELLQTELASGPLPFAELLRRAHREGISESTLREAKKLLNIKAEKSDFSGGWRWRLPNRRGDR